MSNSLQLIDEVIHQAPFSTLELLPFEVLLLIDWTLDGHDLDRIIEEAMLLPWKASSRAMSKHFFTG